MDNDIRRWLEHGGLAEAHKPEIVRWDPVGGDLPCILQDQT